MGSVVTWFAQLSRGAQTLTIFATLAAVLLGAWFRIEARFDAKQERAIRELKVEAQSNALHYEIQNLELRKAYISDRVFELRTRLAPLAQHETASLFRWDGEIRSIENAIIEKQRARDSLKAPGALNAPEP